MRKTAALTLILTLWMTGLAFGWNKPGHMVTGAIALEVLNKDKPAIVQSVVRTLEKHPHFDEMWADSIEHVGDQDRNAYLFMLAARWPDDVRGDSEFDRPKQHYINLPFRPAGQPTSVEIRQPDQENILFGLRANLEVLKGAAPDEKKAVALCWLFHLVGDAHQPLHTATLFTKAFPQGDRGGTRFYVRATATGAPISLHTFWDGLLIGSERFKSVRDRATEIRLTYPREKLNELQNENGPADFEGWLQESFKLAATKAYLEGSLKGSSQKPTAVALPADYAKASRSIAERRAVLAGHRLARLLVNYVKKP